MDASSLRSAISRLSSECSQLERENAAMQREIGAIVSSVQSASHSLTRSCNSATGVLTNSASLIEYSDQTLQAVAAEQDHIAALYRGFKNVETANKKIRELNNKIYFEFANFRMVRKIVRAFIDNINLEMVKPEIIYKSVEKEHLQSPDFWLSAAMLAIMHWKDDNKDAADRALRQALELDEKQTTLFFMSFYLLLGRDDVALKWFEKYETIENTGRDASFALLLLHATNMREEDQSPLAKKICSFLHAEFDKSRQMNSWGEAVEYVKNHLVQYNSSDSFVFNYLRNYVKDYPVMLNALNMAKDNKAILEFVETVNTATRSKGFIYIEKFISEILDTPDKKERAYTDEIAYNEMIIRCVGDLGKADEEFNKVHDREVAPLNLMSECLNWLFGGSEAQISDVARSNMFLLCKDIIADAVKKYAHEYRSTMRVTHPVAIKDYRTEMNFKNQGLEQQKVESYYRAKKMAQLAAVKNTSIVVSIILAVLLFAGGIASMVASFSVGAVLLALMGVCLVGSLICVISAILGNIRNKRKRKQIAENNAAALAAAREIIGHLFEEFEQYLAVYNENDNVVMDVEFAIAR